MPWSQVMCPARPSRPRGRRLARPERRHRASSRRSSPWPCTYSAWQMVSWLTCIMGSSGNSICNLREICTGDHHSRSRRPGPPAAGGPACSPWAAGPARGPADAPATPGTPPAAVGGHLPRHRRDRLEPLPPGRGRRRGVAGLTARADDRRPQPQGVIQPNGWRERSCHGRQQQPGPRSEQRGVVPPLRPGAVQHDGKGGGAQHAGRDQGNRPGGSRVRPDGPNATVEAIHPGLGPGHQGKQATCRT